MRLLLEIVAFWLVVVVAVRVAVCFPSSLFARILFHPLGACRVLGEIETDFLRRRSRHSASWLAQAALLFAVGWLALRWNPGLADSPPFLVLWAMIVPVIGAGALTAAVFDIVRLLLLRRRERTRSVVDGARA
jgi:hypothetical protein